MPSGNPTVLFNSFSAFGPAGAQFDSGTFTPVVGRLYCAIVGVVDSGDNPADLVTCTFTGSGLTFTRRVEFTSAQVAAFRACDVFFGVATGTPTSGVVRGAGPTGGAHSVSGIYLGVLEETDVHTTTPVNTSNVVGVIDSTGTDDTPSVTMNTFLDASSHTWQFVFASGVNRTGTVASPWTERIDNQETGANGYTFGFIYCATAAENENPLMTLSAVASVWEIFGVEIVDAPAASTPFEDEPPPIAIGQPFAQNTVIYG